MINSKTMINKIISSILLITFIFSLSNNVLASENSTGAWATADQNQEISIDINNLNINLDNLKEDKTENTNNNENEENEEDKDNNQKEDEYKVKTATHSSGNFKNPPWSFRKRYDFLDEEFIWIIKANLKVSESFEKMEEWFNNNQKDTEFLEDFYDAIELIKKDVTLSDSERKKMLDLIEKRKKFLIFFFNKAVYPLMKIETSWNGKFNPWWNTQWIFQITYIQYDFLENPKMWNNSRLYYSTKAQAKKVYARNKILTRQDYLTQVADLIIYLTKSNKFYNAYKNIYSVERGWVNYPEQLNHVIDALDLWLTEEEKKDIIKKIIQNDVTSVNSFIQEYKEKLYQYNIIKAEDLLIFKDYILLWAILSYYNGWWNNFTYRKYKFKWKYFNVFDNSYVSTMPQYNMCFLAIWQDFWSPTSNHTKPWMIHRYLLKNYPDSITEKELALTAILSKMKKKWLLLAHVNCH